MRIGVLAAALVFPTGLLAEPAVYSFVWQGAGGYTVQGAVSFDEAARSGPMVLAEDVTCFEIQGFHEGDAIGRWALGQLNEETSWRLHLSPEASAFVVEGYFIDMPQAWNMNGYGNDCGIGGFGLNIGDFAQDICVDNRLITESQVSPFQPFPVTRNDDYVFGENACRPEMLLGALSLR